MRLYKAVAIFTTLSLLPLVPASATDTKPRIAENKLDSYGFMINEDSASIGVTYSSLVAHTANGPGGGQVYMHKP